MYKSYKAYTGQFNRSKESIETVLDGINERREQIVTVCPVGQDSIYVLIITKETDYMVGAF